MDETCYNNQTCPKKGLAVIIVNQDFIPSHISTRKGALSDYDTLLETFTKLEYEVRPHFNKTAQEIIRILFDG